MQDKVAALEDDQQRNTEVIDAIKQDIDNISQSPAAPQQATTVPKVYIYLRHVGPDYFRDGLGFVIGFSSTEGVSEVKISGEAAQDGYYPGHWSPKTVISFRYDSKRYCAAVEKDINFLSYKDRQNKNKDMLIANRKMLEVKACG